MCSGSTQSRGRGPPQTLFSGRGKKTLQPAAKTCCSPRQQHFQHFSLQVLRTSRFDFRLGPIVRSKRLLLPTHSPRPSIGSASMSRIWRTMQLDEEHTTNETWSSSGAATPCRRQPSPHECKRRTRQNQELQGAALSMAQQAAWVPAGNARRPAGAATVTSN